MTESHLRQGSSNDALPGVTTPDLQQLFDETSRPFRFEDRPQRLAQDTRPRAPLSPRDAGLTLDFVCDLTLRHLLLEPAQRGSDLCRKLRLSWPILQPACKTLQRAGCVELGKGQLLPEAAERVTLTALGREQARKSFEASRYVGPAPVPFADYVRQCRLQTPSELTLPAGELQIALADLCFDDETFDALGSAISGGGAMLLRGASGNGKTTIAKRLALAVQRVASPICVPYAVLFEGSVMSVFDPQWHVPVSGEDEAFQSARFPNEPSHESWNRIPDGRWRLVHRPKVLVSSESALQRMSWSVPKTGHVADAPLQVKANGGVCILDDLQRLPFEMIPRLEIMLDERIDTFPLADGNTVTFPVEVLLIGCLRDSKIDAALLRRFRNIVDLPAPNAEQLTQLLADLSAQSGLNLNQSAANLPWERFFPSGRPFNFSDPNNLLETLRGICRFRQMEPTVTDELLELAARRCWGLRERRSA